MWSAPCSASNRQAGYAAPDATYYLDHFATSTSFWNCKQAQVTRQWSLTLNDHGIGAKMHLLGLCKVRCALRCEKSDKILPCICIWLSEKNCIQTLQWAPAYVNTHMSGAQNPLDFFHAGTELLHDLCWLLMFLSDPSKKSDCKLRPNHLYWPLIQTLSRRRVLCSKSFHGLSQCKVGLSFAQVS